MDEEEGGGGSSEEARASLELVAAPLRQAVEVLAADLQDGLELRVRQVPLRRRTLISLTITQLLKDFTNENFKITRVNTSFYKHRFDIFKIFDFLSAIFCTESF